MLIEYILFETLIIIQNTTWTTRLAQMILFAYFYV